MSLAAPSQPLPPLRRLVVLAGDIKLSHTVFAMPFALLATFLGAAHGGGWPGAGVLGLIVLCMVLARTVAMAVNRWADARIDAANPRTAGRAVPRGALSPRFMLYVALFCAGAFVALTGGFYLLEGNPWPVILSPLVLAYLAAYSFTKRFTWLCHLFLGGALALSPLAAGIAVEPGWLASGAPYLLAGVVLCWVAGFDIIYALQDVEVDRRAGLFSMPANLGVERALHVGRALHLLVVLGLAALVWVSPVLGPAFAVAAGLTTALLVLEHLLVWRSSTNHIHLAFFTVNGMISLLLAGAGIVDVFRYLA